MFRATIYELKLVLEIQQANIYLQMSFTGPWASIDQHGTVIGKKTSDKL